MRTAVFQLQDILSLFRRKKVLTKEELLEQAGCSTMTAWRLLHRHGYFTSYNDNARHYTIAGIPDFDERGLWTYRGARFSRWGSLTKTIVALVENSVAGLTAEQLETMLNARNVKPILSRLIEEQLIAREKVSGPFVYFSLKEKDRAKQDQQRRKDALQATAERRLPSLDQIIALLVEIIRRPRGTTREWARHLGRRGIRMKTKDIDAVLAHYEIDLKKGLSKS